MSIASISDQGGFQRSPAAPKGPASPVDLQRLVRLLTALQTTLEIPELVALFARELESFIPGVAVEYRHAANGLAATAGARGGRHHCDYRLSMGGMELGELSLRRGQRFSAAELAGLESLLALLVHPLRNALLYFEAVHAAVRDPLTGLRNRKGLEEALDKEITRARRYAQGFALLFLDLDHFKRINDLHGHLGGDAVLTAFAALLEQEVRGCDWIFRFGGEEFAALLPNTSQEGALQLAERIRAATEALAVPYKGHAVTLTVSVGVTVFRTPDECRDVMERVDLALYRAKRAGRNRVELARDSADLCRELG